jgi:hypothetical protein
MFRTIFGFLGTKIGISLLASIVIIGSAFAIKSTDFMSGRAKASPTLSAEKEATKQAFEKDSDNDGLKDWEEALYGTNPLNPDTKGNGLGDAKEVEKEREAVASATTTPEKTITLTATEKFSRELFTKYLEAKRSGQEITPELSEAIAEELVAKGYDQGIPAFDDGVLTTIQTNDTAFIRNYGNQIGKIVLTPMPEGTSNELLILEQILAKGTPTDKNMADLNKILGRYQSMRDALVKTKVPLQAKDAHAQLIQGIEVVMNVVTGIKDLQSDPVGGYSKISQYEDGATLVSAGSLRLKQYFATVGISFSPSESGYVFTQP